MGREGRHFDDSSVAGSDAYGSHSGGGYGGCCCGGGGGGGLAVPLLIAAIAAATAFLFIAITMAGRRRRKRRGLVDGEEGTEQDGVDNIMDIVWIGKRGNKAAEK